MSHLGDTRRGRGGPGILPLQSPRFRAREMDLEDRESILASRIADRLVGPGEAGDFLYEDAGDLVGGWHWPASTRITGSWSWVRASVVPSSATTPGHGDSETPRAVGDQPSVGPPTNRRDAAETDLNHVEGERPVVTTKAHFDFLVSIGKNPIYKGILWNEDGSAIVDGVYHAPGTVPVNPPGFGAGGVIVAGLGGPTKIGAAPFGGVVGVPIPIGAGGGAAVVFGGGALGGGTGYVPLIGGNYQARFVLNPDPGGNPVNVLAKKNDSSAQANGKQQNAEGQSLAWMSGVEEEERFDGGRLPVNAGWAADRRYERLSATTPQGFPDYPGGTYFVAVQATDEDRQVELHLPADPRLIADHRSSPSTFGTPVCDVVGQALDPDYQAPLQSQFFVVRRPVGSRGALKANGDRNSPRNALARVIGPTGLGDTFGGLCLEFSGGRHVLTTESAEMGGPFSSGGARDGHVIGRDADGTQITRGHLVTQALFKYSDREDGPILFEHYYPEYTEDLLIPVKCHLAWRESSQQWEIWTTTDVYSPPTQTRDPVSPPTDPPDGPPTEITPGHNPPGTPGGDPDQNGRNSGEPGYDSGPGPGQATPEDRRRAQGRGTWSGLASVLREPSAGAAMVKELTLPSISGRPSLVTEGMVDFRFNPAPRMNEVRRHDVTAPITFRLEAYGAQGGPAGGPYLTEAHEWVYTQEPGESRWPGGTAAGGLFFDAPEVDMGDVDDDFAPGNLTVSTPTFLVGPNARIGVGLPEISGGGLRSGVAMAVDSEDLVFTRHDSSGAAGATIALIELAQVKVQTGSDFVAGAPENAGELADIDAGGQIQFGYRLDTDELQVSRGGTVRSVTFT